MTWNDKLPMLTLSVNHSSRQETAPMTKAQQARIAALNAAAAQARQRAIAAADKYAAAESALTAAVIEIKAAR